MASYIFFLELFTRNFNSRTWKNSHTGSTKVGVLMVGRMFTVTTMSCWGERFTEIGTGSGLLGIVPWCAIVTYSATWEVAMMAMA